MARVSYGFVRTGGKWSRLDFPKATVRQVYGINDFGVAVGSYLRISICRNILK